MVLLSFKFNMKGLISMPIANNTAIFTIYFYIFHLIVVFMSSHSSIPVKPVITFVELA